MMLLDDRDKAIIRELQRDGTLSADDLAARVQLSRNACWRRMKALEEHGVLRKRVALADPVALNVALSVMISVRTSRHSGEWADQFRKAILGIPEIVAAYRTAGDIDYILHARIPDVSAYDRLYKKLIERVDMVDVSASFVMEEIKSSTELPLEFLP
jgi:Lrp/AsnC family transcriptional regulator